MRSLSVAQTSALPQPPPPSPLPSPPSPLPSSSLASLPSPQSLPPLPLPLPPPPCPLPHLTHLTRLSLFTTLTSATLYSLPPTCGPTSAPHPYHLSCCAQCSVPPATLLEAHVLHVILTSALMPLSAHIPRHWCQPSSGLLLPARRCNPTTRFKKRFPAMPSVAPRYCAATTLPLAGRRFILFSSMGVQPPSCLLVRGSYLLSSHVS